MRDGYDEWTWRPRQSLNRCRLCGEQYMAAHICPDRKLDLARPGQMARRLHCGETKPRIRLFRGRWECFGGGRSCMGASPVAAYVAWALALGNQAVACLPSQQGQR